MTLNFKVDAIPRAEYNALQQQMLTLQQNITQSRSEWAKLQNEYEVRYVSGPYGISRFENKCDFRCGLSKTIWFVAYGI